MATFGELILDKIIEEGLVFCSPDSVLVWKDDAEDQLSNLFCEFEILRRRVEDGYSAPFIVKLEKEKTFLIETLPNSDVRVVETFVGIHPKTKDVIVRSVIQDCIGSEVCLTPEIIEYIKDLDDNKHLNRKDTS